MKCFMCKGELRKGTTNHVVTLENGCIVIVKNVPCLCCKQCGETYYTDTVAERLDEIVEQVSSFMTEIAVVEYSNVNVA